MEQSDIRTRQELMGQFGARGGPRSLQVAGTYVDVLGSFENSAQTPVRTIAAPFGNVALCPVEELIVEQSSFPNIHKTIHRLWNVLRSFWARPCNKKSKQTGMRSGG